MYCIALAGLKLNSQQASLLYQPPQCWDYRLVSPCLSYPDIWNAKPDSCSLGSSAGLGELVRLAPVSPSGGALPCHCSEGCWALAWREGGRERERRPADFTEWILMGCDTGIGNPEMLEHLNSRGPLDWGYNTGIQNEKGRAV